jgi:hypothetical protein
LINTYLPAHSDGFSRQEMNSALAFIDSLRLDFPGDSFLMGGDLNVDKWRTTEQRARGQTITTRTRLAETFLNALTSSGWAYEPSSRTITYVSGDDESAIDYWLFSSQVVLSNVQVGGTLAAQHRPVSATASFMTLDGSFFDILVTFFF